MYNISSGSFYHIIYSCFFQHNPKELPYLRTQIMHLQMRSTATTTMKIGRMEIMTGRGKGMKKVVQHSFLNSRLKLKSLKYPHNTRLDFLVELIVQVRHFKLRHNIHLIYIISLYYFTFISSDELVEFVHFRFNDYYMEENGY